MKYMIIFSLFLSACASWTPEQKADFYARMAASAKAQRDYAEANKTTHCQTQYFGSFANTTCH